MIAFIPDLLDKSDFGSNLLVVEIFALIISLFCYVGLKKKMPSYKSGSLNSFTIFKYL